MQYCIPKDYILRNLFRLKWYEKQNYVITRNIIMFLLYHRDLNILGLPYLCIVEILLMDILCSKFISNNIQGCGITKHVQLNYKNIMYTVGGCQWSKWSSSWRPRYEKSATITSPRHSEIIDLDIHGCTVIWLTFMWWGQLCDAGTTNNTVILWNIA